MDVLSIFQLEASTGIRLTPEIAKAVDTLRAHLMLQNCSIDAICVATPRACDDFCFDYLGVPFKVKKT